jgi:hypothetical protein
MIAHQAPRKDGTSVLGQVEWWLLLSGGGQRQQYPLLESLDVSFSSEIILELSFDEEWFAVATCDDLCNAFLASGYIAKITDTDVIFTAKRCIRSNKHVFLADHPVHPVCFPICAMSQSVAVGGALLGQSTACGSALPTNIVTGSGLRFRRGMEYCSLR